MVETVGVSKSSVSRETIEASEAALQDVLERRLEHQDVLVVYIDGLHCGERCVIGAVGVDTEGGKWVLGIHEGATENAAACKDRLENLGERGWAPQRPRWFVINGAKAFPSPTNRGVGPHAALQRSP